MEKWIEFCKWAKNKPRCYFLGMGDYDDLASTSERGILGDSKLHDSTRITLEQMYEKHTDRLAKEMDFMKGRLIGLIEGNHYSLFSDGCTTTQRLCYKLGGVKYLGVTCFIVLILRYDRTHAHRAVIWAHHGLGAGRLVGGSINKVEQMEKNAEADIYLMGHDHKKSAALLNKLCIRDAPLDYMEPSMKKILLARTGTFLRGYSDKYPSYVADAGMSPTDIGVVKIELTPKREQLRRNGKKQDYRWVDIHASI